jgi:hypothetical protein
LVACIECKWSESGLGTCSCEKDRDGSPLPGNPCAARVAARSAYWRVADEFSVFRAGDSAFSPVRSA